MQQAVGFFAQRLSEKLVVKFVDFRVFMGESEFHFAVGIKEPLGAEGTQFIGDAIGLTAAADASAWATHDLDEVIFVRFFANDIKQVAGVTKSMSNSNANFPPHFDIDLTATSLSLTVLAIMIPLRLDKS